MGQPARISRQQLTFLVFTLHFAAAVMVLPASLAKAGKSGGWFASLISYLVAALPVALLLGLLLRRHPGQGFGQVSCQVLGPLPGRALAAVLGLFSLGLAALCLRDVVEVIPVTILPSTPPLALALPFVLVAAYGAYCGAEVLARLSVLFMTATAVVVLLTLATLTRLAHPYRLLPLWDHTPLQLFAAVWPSSGWFAESWTFLSLAALVEQPRFAGRGLAVGALLATVHLMFFTALATAVFGHQLVADFTFPVYSLFQQITLGEFVERLDVILISIWLLGMIVKTAVHLWLAASAAASALRLAGERSPLIVLGAAAVVWMSLIPNLPWLFTFSTVLWTPLSLSLGLGVPFLLLAASWVRARRRRQPNMPA